MTDVCNICEEALNNLPCTELLCHHKYHTQCFLTNVATGIHNIDMIQCVVCHMSLFPEEDEDEPIQQAEGAAYLGEAEIQTLFDTNEQFRQDLKIYVKTSEASSKPRRTFQRFLVVKKRELKEECNPLFQQLKTFYTAKKEQIVESNEFKEFKKTESKWRRSYKYVKQTYGVDSYNLQFLRSKPGMRRLHAPPWYLRSPMRIIKRSLGYYRMRF